MLPRILFLFLILFVTNAVSGDTVETRVLFIGNSYTYWNDLPKVLETMVQKGARQKLVAESIAFPDYALEDHWNRGDALKAIQKKRWNFVVLQQGPSASNEGRTTLLKYSTLFAKAIDASGARTLMFSAWPSRLRIGETERAIESYRMAATEVNGILVPVAKAWRIARELQPDIALYDRDGLHPSAAGSYLAALVFYNVLLRKSYEGPPLKIGQVSIDRKISDWLLRAATASVTNSDLR